MRSGVNVETSSHYLCPQGHVWGLAQLDQILSKLRGHRGIHYSSSPPST